MKWTLHVAGLERDLQLCPINSDLMIGALLILGDTELTVACASELLKRAPEYDYLLTAEAKAIPLVHEMARQNGDLTYFVARKGIKLYMDHPYGVSVKSITTEKDQRLYIDRSQMEAMKGKRILIVDDVISTGKSLEALERLADAAGGIIVGKMSILAEGEAAKRKDITFLEKLPLFDGQGQELPL